MSDHDQPPYPAPDARPPAGAPHTGAPGAAPYAALTPDCILDSLATLGHVGDGRLIALNSYENRVYQVFVDGGAPLVMKFYRPERWSDEQILEEHAFARELADLEIPVVPALSIAGATLHRHAGFRFAVFARQGGRAPELDDGATLEWIGRFVGRIHAVGRVHDFRQRPPIDIDTFGIEPRNWLLAHRFVPADLLAAWSAAVDQALAGVRRAYERAGDVLGLRLHGDCHPGNVLWTDDGPHFVDFDDCRMGPAIQDLWMLTSGDRSEVARQFDDLMAGYEDFMEFDNRELHLVEALRTLRLIHYSAWLARRWDDPAFPAAFPWFNTQRYWQDRVLELREQIALLDEEPIDRMPR